MSEENAKDQTGNPISRRKMLASIGAMGAALAIGNLMPNVRTAYAHSATDSVFNVKMYGAVGDGVTDDTAAIQSAINAAAAVQGVAFFPSGTYLVSQLNVNSNFVKLEGVDASAHGSILTSNSNLPILYVTHICTIEKIALFGASNNAFTLQDGIFINNTNDVYVRDVFIKDTYNGIHIKDSVFYSYFDNVRFYTAVNCLVYGEGTVPQGYAVQFNNCQATVGYATYGFYFDNCGSVIIDSLMMSPTNITYGSIVVNSLAPLAGVQQISNTVIEGSMAIEGLSLKGTALNPIKYVFVSNSYIAGNPSVLIDYGTDIFFENCYFTGSADGGSTRNAISTTYYGNNLALSNCKYQVTNTPITASSGCSTLSLDIVNPVYAGGYPFIYLPHLPSSSVKHLSVLGGKIGSNANPIDLSLPNSNVMVQVEGFRKYENNGIFVTNGTVTQTIYIPHGLAYTPNYCFVQAGSQDAGTADIFCVERDATNLIVTLRNLPPIGTNNLVFLWTAKL